MAKEETSTIMKMNPALLERAADALRDINKQRNSDKVFGIMEQDLKTEETRNGLERAKIEAQQEQIRWDKQSQLMKEQEMMRQQAKKQEFAEKQKLAKYNDDLARKREAEMQQASLQIERQKNQDRLAAEQRINAERKKSAKELNDMKMKQINQREIARAKGKILEDRENKDIMFDKIKLKAELQRAALMKKLEFYAERMKDPRQMAIGLGAVTAAGLTLSFGHQGFKTVWNHIGAVWGKPMLIRETSRVTATSSMKNALGGLLKPKDAFLKGVVLEESLEMQMNQIMSASKYQKQNSLFFGPPGTGKTLIARKMAHSAGMDYAIMSGGDVGPLGNDAVTEIHKVFNWAKKSKKGLLLFIDEADAFLKNRKRFPMSDAQRNALNAFLFQTGTESQDFMMALATNLPEDIDPAVLDRVANVVEFTLPNKESRERLLKQYFDERVRYGHLVKHGNWLKRAFTKGLSPIDISEEVEDSFSDLAELTENMSGREIEQMMSKLQAILNSSGTTKLDGENFPQLIQMLLELNVQRRTLREFLSLE